MCFLVFVVAMLLFPMSKIDDATMSQSENRNLQKLPALSGKQGFNYAYGKQFEAWLNDHFRGRERLLAWHDRLEGALSFHVENSIAMEGRDGWLFYKGNNSVIRYQNLYPFTQAELEKIKKRLEEKRDYCRSVGADYYILIAPDKNKVYGEFFPSRFRKVNPMGRAEQLYNYLRQSSDLKIVYPLQTLLAAKGEDELYYRNDTHWNSLGAYYGYRELMQLIKKDYPSLYVVDEQAFHVVQEASGGDLQGMLKLKERKYSSSKVIFDKKIDFKVKKMDSIKGITKDNGRQIQITDSASPYRVLVFRDSFSTALIPYFAQSFGHVELLWTREFEKNKYYLPENKPDIVIEEVVERLTHNMVH